MSWWTAVLPVVTLIVGAALTVFADERRERRSAKRDDVQADRVLADRRDEFELRILLEVEEALHRLTADVAEYRLRRKEGQHTEITSDMLQYDTREVTRLMHLVLDDSIRSAIQSTRDEVNAAVMQETGGLAAMLHGLDLAAKAQAVIGERVRTIYLASVTNS